MNLDANHLLASMLCVLCTQAVSADEAMLVGGGYAPHASQAQIELNLHWTRDLFEANDIPTTVFVNDGNEEGADVHFRVPDDQQESSFGALSRVFGDVDLELLRYREHELGEVAGSTRRSDLLPAFEQFLERTADAPVMLVYNGHGAPAERRAADTSLVLWGDDYLTAREMHALIGKHRQAYGTPFRYLMTQCYSGGFHRLAYADVDNGTELSSGLRCGFTSESAWQLAEGCSASIDTDDYRDYSSYFLAALAGHDRDGEILDREPDTDASGDVSLREAHFHALEKAHSTDLPRSTSEDWLETWQPWYLRWLPAPIDLPNNEYARLFRTLTVEAGLTLDARIGKRLRSRLDELRDSQLALTEGHDTLRQSILGIQDELQRATLQRWPALLGPYTTAYRDMAASGELDTVSEWLVTQDNFNALAQAQARDAEMEVQGLAIERDVTQTRKLLRLRHLATLKSQLEHYGTSVDKTNYARLLSCEEMPLSVSLQSSADDSVGLSAESLVE